MIPRHAQETALRLARGFPILVVTGPRQSGKTTLARALFPDRDYVTLEDPEQREFATTDPRRFLARFRSGAVIDEVQRAPDLLSYLQGIVDERRVISHSTASEWLSVLEASYLVVRLPPYHVNFGKRLVKSPKLYFLDTGLAAALLGIGDADGLSIHAQRGALFETWVVSEVMKQRCNAGQPHGLFFWRDNTGNAVDLLFKNAGQLHTVEIKSGATFTRDWLKAPKRWRQLAGDQAAQPLLIHGGEHGYEREDIKILPWRSVGELLPIRTHWRPKERHDGCLSDEKDP
ncbi:hypothetical protein Thiowin_03438 [Thiorhodovibrio winogradskyi]|uniref:DUF4143 domain-containing protein n=1 Tax=Thiorhodovibrio winogradskyi TaxID=77007 RepID=A0ABZ0SD29_9GAMM|nr:ATP-binding protein [Thiorhodovibrio winogradskyi]